MSQVSKILLLIGIFCILISNSNNEAKEMPKIITKTYVKAYKIECDFNPEYVENITCNLLAKSWTRSIIDFKCDLKKPLRNVSLNAGFYKRYSEFRPYMFNYTVNACNLLNGKANIMIATAVYKLLKPLSNLNHSCPYEGTIIASGMELKESYLPVTGFFMPLGRYRTTIRLTEGYPPEDLGSLNIYGEVFEKRIKVSNV